MKIFIFIEQICTNIVSYGKIIVFFTGRGKMKKKIFLSLIVFIFALSANFAFAAGKTTKKAAKKPAKATSKTTNKSVFDRNSVSKKYTNCANYSEEKNDNLKGYVLYVPIGTTVNAVLSQDVNSKSIVSGAVVNAILIEDFKYKDNLIASSGSIVQGNIVKARKANLNAKYAQIQIRFTSIRTPYNNVIPISAMILTSDKSGIVKSEIQEGGGIKLSANTKIQIYFDQPITLGAQ